MVEASRSWGKKSMWQYMAGGLSRAGQPGLQDPILCAQTYLRLDFGAWQFCTAHRCPCPWSSPDRGPSRPQGRQTRSSLSAGMRLRKRSAKVQGIQQVNQSHLLEGPVQHEGTSLERDCRDKQLFRSSHSLLFVCVHSTRAVHDKLRKDTSPLCVIIDLYRSTPRWQSEHVLWEIRLAASRSRRRCGSRRRGSGSFTIVPSHRVDHSNTSAFDSLDHAFGDVVVFLLSTLGFGWCGLLDLQGGHLGHRRSHWHGCVLLRARWCRCSLIRRAVKRVDFLLPISTSRTVVRLRPLFGQFSLP